MIQIYSKFSFADTYGPPSPCLQRGRFAVIPEEPQTCSPSISDAQSQNREKRTPSPEWDFNTEVNEASETNFSNSFWRNFVGTLDSGSNPTFENPFSEMRAIGFKTMEKCCASTLLVATARLYLRKANDKTVKKKNNKNIKRLMPAADMNDMPNGRVGCGPPRTCTRFIIKGNVGTKRASMNGEHKARWRCDDVYLVAEHLAHHSNRCELTLETAAVALIMTE